MRLLWSILLTIGPVTGSTQETVCDLFKDLKANDGRQLIVTGELLTAKDLLALGVTDCDNQYISPIQGNSGPRRVWPTAINLAASKAFTASQRKELDGLMKEADQLRAAGKRAVASGTFAGRLRVDPAGDFPAELTFDSFENLTVEALPDAATLPVIPICDLFQNLTAWKGKRISVRGESYSTMESSGLSARCKGAFITNGYRWPVALSYSGPAYYSGRTAQLFPVDQPRTVPKGESALRGRHNVVKTATYVGYLRMRGEYKAFCRPGGDYITNGFGHLNYAAAELIVEAIRDVELTPRGLSANADDAEDPPCSPPNSQSICAKVNTLLGAISNGCLERAAQLLASDGIDSKDGSESPALDAAIRQGNEPIVRLLIEKGASVNPRGVRMWPPLAEAAHFSRIAIMKLLLKSGADPEAKDNHGVSYLPTYGFFDSRVTKLLLDSGANANARDDEGRTALMHAAGYGYEESAEFLIDHHADVNLSDNSGRTALMHAAAGKYVDAIPHILDRHADVYAKDRAGETAIDIARKAKNEVAVELLSSAMKNPQ